MTVAVLFKPGYHRAAIARLILPVPHSQGWRNGRHEGTSMADGMPGEAASTDGWREHRSTGFMDDVGPLLVREVDSRTRYAVRTAERHLNGFGIVHGGVVLTLLDNAVGMFGARHHDGVGQATMQLNVSFVAPVHAGSLLEADCEVVRVARSVMFLRGTAYVGDTVVAVADGIWKIARTRKPAEPQGA